MNPHQPPRFCGTKWGLQGKRQISLLIWQQLAVSPESPSFRQQRRRGKSPSARKHLTEVMARPDSMRYPTHFFIIYSIYRRLTPTSPQLFAFENCPKAPEHCMLKSVCQCYIHNQHCSLERRTSDITCALWILWPLIILMPVKRINTGYVNVVKDKKDKRINVVIRVIPITPLQRT